MKISIIHASYGRADLQTMTAWKWMDNTSGKHDIEYLLSIDKSDTSLYPDAISYKQDYITAKVIKNDTNTSVAAINKAASVATGDIFVVISDDFDCPKNWDDLIVEQVQDKTDWILKTQDETQPWIITLPIMDRAYYESYGYVYPPAYTHMFCDTHLTHQADITGCKLTSLLEFKHNHYSVGGIAKDATSIKADSTWNVGEYTYLAQCRKWQELGLDVLGLLPPEAAAHKNWLKQRI